MSSSNSRVKTELIQVRASPEEKDLLKQRAAAFGISVGELCRETIFGTKPKSKTDQQAIAELAKARADLGRLGGLFRGWLTNKFDQSAPGPVTKEKIWQLIESIDQQKDDLNAIANRVIK